MQFKCNFSEQNLPSRENQTCEGEIPRQTTNPSGDCYSILQTELIENSYDYWIVMTWIRFYIYLWYKCIHFHAQKCFQFDVNK